MPSFGWLITLSISVLFGSLVYQNPQPFIAPITNSRAYQAFQPFFENSHCYSTIRTNAAGLPHGECFTVANGKFKRVFTNGASSTAAKEKREGHVIPGFWDGHGHLSQFGESLDSVDLFGTKSMDEVKFRLVEYKARHQEAGTGEQWLRGVGWDQANFEGQWPVAKDLEIDGQFKDLYVMLDRVDVHCIWVSEKVLSLLPDPLPQVPGGDIPAKGVFCDNAMDIVLEYYPKPSKARRTKWIQDAMSELNKHGIVGMHDAGVTPAELKLYEELSGNDAWTVRVYAMIECETRNTFCPDKVAKISTPNGKFHVQSVKLFGDGALGSWGSAMIEPYSDKESSSGTLLVNATTLSKVTYDWAHAGYQVNIHAIGDLANRLAIDAFEAALKTLCPESIPRECQTKYRFRIEHAQIIHPNDQRRMFELGIIPSVQPTHATSDMPYAETRLGKRRTETEAYRMRSLLPLKPVFGSDFPVEPADVFEGIYAAVARRSPRTGLDAHGKPKGWYESESVTLEDALQGFTVNPAYAAFLEGKAGVIEAGAYADWIVLDEPLETMDVEALRTLRVKETWVGGRLVYKRPAVEVYNR